MNQPICIGIIGAGAIGKVHLETFAKLGGESVNVAAITDSYLPLAKQRAEEFGVKNVHPNPQSMLEDSTIDAVVVAVPNQFHAPLAIEALKQGKHVLLEKPMAIDVEAARTIYETQRSSGKVLMMAQQMRWNGINRAIKSLLKTETLAASITKKPAGYEKKAYRVGVPGLPARIWRVAVR